MELLTDLVTKCWNNNLAIDLSPHNYGSVAVWDFTNKDKKTSRRITEGSLKEWVDESPEDTLNRMHKEVDAYLNRISVPFMDDETEHAQARLTEYERKLKESGHKQSDFL